MSYVKYFFPQIPEGKSPFPPGKKHYSFPLNTMEKAREDSLEAKNEPFRASWWTKRMCPLILPIQENKPLYSKFSCRSFEGCSTTKWDGLRLEVEIFIRGMQAPTIELGSTRSAKQSERQAEDNELETIFRHMSVTCWAHLSRFGVVGPDSIQSVVATEAEVREYQGKFHILAGVQEAAEDLRVVASVSRANPSKHEDVLYNALAAVKAQLDLAMQKAEKAPKIRKGGSRHLVICSEGDLPLFVRNDCRSVLGRSDRLSVWRRTDDSIHVVAGEIRPTDDHGDLCVRVDGPALNYPRVGSISGKVDVLVFQTGNIGYHRSWEYLLKASKIEVNRLVVASSFQDERNRLDIDLKRGWKRDFTQLMMDCFEWSPNVDKLDQTHWSTEQTYIPDGSK
jgi:hypothetical protein